MRPQTILALRDRERIGLCPKNAPVKARERVLANALADTRVNA
jgi:hypothetical protein